MAIECSICRRCVCLHLYPGLADEKPDWLLTEEEQRRRHLFRFSEPMQTVFAPYVPIMPKKP